MKLPKYPIIVWKVLRDGHSSDAKGKFSLPYEKNVKRLPAEGTKFLFAFDSEEEAKAFAFTGTLVTKGLKIVPCMAMPYQGEYPAFVTSNVSEDHINVYWKTGEAYRQLPTGAPWVLCEWIEPMEETI